MRVKGRKAKTKKKKRRRAKRLKMKRRRMKIRLLKRTTFPLTTGNRHLPSSKKIITKGPIGNNVMSLCSKWTGILIRTL